MLEVKGGPFPLQSSGVPDKGSNDVRVVPGVGQGYFHDQAEQVIPVGTNPGPLFVGGFTGREGELDLVTVNSGSNDLTFIPNFLFGGVVQSISSGGIDPVAAIAGDFGEEGHLDLLVANAGDGHLALFLGGGRNWRWPVISPTRLRLIRRPWHSTRSAGRSSSFLPGPKGVRRQSSCR